MRLIFLGGPGAGKGTQASRVSVEFNIPHISTGEIFRENIKNKTELGLKAKDYIDKGQLCPDELTVGLVADRIKGDDCKNGFLFDGFPRTINQAEFLSEILNENNIPLDAAVNIAVDDEVIIERMSGRRVCPTCGESFHVIYNKPAKENICDKCNAELIIRDDDAPETVKERLITYHKMTAPLLDYYKEKGILIDVNGNQEIDKITAEIVEQLKNK